MLGIPKEKGKVEHFIVFQLRLSVDKKCQTFGTKRAVVGHRKELEVVALTKVFQITKQLIQNNSA